MNKHKELLTRYTEILAKPEHQNLLNKIQLDKKFSNVHFSFVPEQYEQATHKILIIGRETRGWKYKLPFQQYDLQTIEQGMLKSQTHFEEHSQKGTKGRSFFNFVHKVGKKSGVDGVIWANIFALDYARTHPKKSNFFNEIKLLSNELLHATIDVLQPEIILFVTGSAGIRARLEYFPDLKPSGNDTDHIPKHLLERFYFDNQNIICYRAPHPSARSKERQQALKHLISLLPQK